MKFALKIQKGVLTEKKHKLMEKSSLFHCVSTLYGIINSDPKEGFISPLISIFLFNVHFYFFLSLETQELAAPEDSAAYQ